MGLADFLPVVGHAVDYMVDEGRRGQDRADAERANKRNAALQKEFAQNGVRWRVADAKAAGIHPLAALGMNPVQGTPSFVGGGSSGGGGGEFSAFGADLSRAVSAGETKDERLEKLQDLQLERGELENTLLRSRIARENSAQVPPPVPDILDVPLERTRSMPGRQWEEVGSVADVGYADAPGGRLSPVPSKDVKQRIEDNIIQETLWAIRNNLVPSLGQGARYFMDKFVPGSSSLLGDQTRAPSRSRLPKGAVRWDYDLGRQEWFPVFKKRR